MNCQQRNYLLALFLILACGTARADDVKTTAQDMSFEKCQMVIAQTASKVGMAPINIVETPIMRMVKFPTNNGYVLVTCPKSDEKMVITEHRIERTKSTKTRRRSGAE